jgi:hypothetical protein
MYKILFFTVYAAGKITRAYVSKHPTNLKLSSYCLQATSIFKQRNSALKETKSSHYAVYFEWS